MKHELRNWNNWNRYIPSEFSFPAFQYSKDFLPFPHVFDDWDDDFFNDQASMKTDLVKKDDNYEMKIEVPGFDKKDIQIELVDGYLCVSANKTSETNEKDDKGTIIRQERCGDSCSRRFYIGDGYKQEDFKANFTNGELTITFPCLDDQKQADKQKILIE